jgi:hypothetical protein
LRFFKLLKKKIIRLKSQNRKPDPLLLKIGIRTMVLETDPYGNFLKQGYEVGSGHDWTRLGISIFRRRMEREAYSS